MILRPLVALVATAITITDSLVQAETFSGEATTYGGNALGGTCGFQSPWSSWSTTSIGLTVALNAPQWINSLNCGRCASVRYGNNPPVTVQIVDQCPECKHGDLDMAPAAYAAIIKKGPGREPITWSFVECPDLFATSDLEFVLKAGSNPYWAAFQPQNFKIGIHTVEIDTGNGWKGLVRNEHEVVGYYFVYTGGIKGSFRLRATSVAGQTIVTPMYNSLQGSMQTEKQFTSTHDTVQVETPVIIQSQVPPHSSPIAVPVITPGSVPKPGPVPRPVPVPVSRPAVAPAPGSGPKPVPGPVRPSSVYETPMANHCT